MEIVKESISRVKLAEMAGRMFGNMVKAVVDVGQGVMAVNGELHADLLEMLMEQRKSQPKDCWGINLYPENKGFDFVEFDSMINLKPGLGNRTRNVEDAKVREKIMAVVHQLCSTKD